LEHKEIFLCLLSCMPYVIYATAYAAGYEISQFPFQLLSTALCVAEHLQAPTINTAAIHTFIELAPLSLVHPTLATLQGWLRPAIKTGRLFNSILRPIQGIKNAVYYYKYNASMSIKAFSIRTMNTAFAALRAWHPLPTF
jgi:hypothetical protein